MKSKNEKPVNCSFYSKFSSLFVLFIYFDERTSRV